MSTAILRTLLLCLSLHAGASQAATWVQGQVSWVSDGDTLWLRPDAGQNLGQIRLQKGRLKLRLHGIDAPEICQAWGSEARAALQAKTTGLGVRAQLLQRDSYGRWLARIYIESAGQAELNLNAWLVSQGHAWDYAWGNSRSQRYALQQAQARTAKRGLWQDSAMGSAMPPWQFRRQHGSCHTEAPAQAK